jgi:hypothetical protein
MPLEFDPETVAFRPSLVTFQAPLFVLVRVVKVLFVVNRSLNLAFHYDLGGYNIEQEGSSRSSWGSTFVKLVTNFLPF